jgi:hypothetical protein
VIVLSRQTVAMERVDEVMAVIQDMRGASLDDQHAAHADLSVTGE